MEEAPHFRNIAWRFRRARPVGVSRFWLLFRKSPPDPPMITRFFARPLHEHADAAQRIQGVAELEPESDELVRLVATDPSADVRAAAATRCRDLNALASALQT